MVISSVVRSGIFRQAGSLRLLLQLQHADSRLRERWVRLSTLHLHVPEEFELDQHWLLDPMTSATYSVSVTTLWGMDGLDSNQAYGVWHSDGSRVTWPATLTSISIQSQSPITEISAITKTLYTTSGIVTATSTFGQLLSAGSPVPWPAGSIGNVANINAPSAATPTSSTTPGRSISGSTSTEATSTRNGSNKDPTSTASQSPPASQHSSHSPSLATGAIAGIAIGCAVAGLAIGLLVAFCLFRRKGKRSKSRESVVLHHEAEKIPSEMGTPVHDIPLSQFLLEPTPDRDIAQETQSIGALIDQHVDSYYHSHRVSADPRALAAVLTDLGFQSTTNSASLDAHGATALCLDPRSRRVGLRHILMRVFFSSIDVRSRHGPSMLPESVASFLRAVPPTESDRFGDPQGKQAHVSTHTHKPSSFHLE